MSKKHANWRKIKEKRYGTHYEMYLADELPRFGCGYRIFYVKEGRKWANFTRHLGDPADTKGRIRGRLSMAQWKDIQRKQLQRNVVHLLRDLGARRREG